MENFLKDIKGFKYPDIELTRWFFKQGLDKIQGKTCEQSEAEIQSKVCNQNKTKIQSKAKSNFSNKKVLEFGSHNANNLSLFASYDYECVGVERDEENLKNADFNFKKLGLKATFIKADMRDFARHYKDINASVLLIPNVLNYISKDECRDMLKNIRQNRLYRWGGGVEFSYLFVRSRSVRDWRYGKGRAAGEHSFVLENDEFSGEKGLFCACYQQFELVDMFKDELNLYDFETLQSENLNAKNGVFIKDSDIILYGKIK